MVDFEYEKDEQKAREIEQEENDIAEHNMIYNEENSAVMNVLGDSMLDMSFNRSGRIRAKTATIDQYTQTDSMNSERPEIRKVRNFTEEIKANCANVSSK